MNMAEIKCNELYNTYDINLINGAMSHCCKFKTIPLNINELEWEAFQSGWNAAKKHFGVEE